MNYVIRKASTSPLSSYRGTYRQAPYFQNQFEETHPVNKAFFRYLDHTDSLGIFNDLQIGKEIVDIYNRFLTNENYELLAVGNANEQPSQHNNYLGIDISSGLNLSHLLILLENWNAEDATSAYRGQEYESLFFMLQYFVSQNVNEYMLLTKLKDAMVILDYMKCIDKYNRGLWDDPSKYVPVMLWSIYSAA